MQFVTASSNTSTKPEFATVMKVLSALGVQLVAKPKEREAA
jgi:DNA-binding phage protein